MRRLAFHGLLASPGLVPIVAPYLPFQDWGLHLAIIGAYAHLDEPGSLLAQWLKPAHSLNALFGEVAGALAKHMSPLWAANLLLALSIGALGPAVARLCRVAGGDRRAAVLAIPLALGHHVYCGFAPNAAALVPFVLSIAELIELSKAESLQQSARISLRLWALLSVMGLLHGFVFLSTAGLALVWLLSLVRRRPHAFGCGLLALVMAMMVVLPTLKVPGVSTDLQSALKALWEAAINEDRSTRHVELFDWLFASYRYSKIDDALQAIWMIAILFLVAQGLSGSSSKRLVTPVGLTLAAFVALPTNIGPPVNWWGAGLRLPPMAFLLLIPIASCAESFRWPRVSRGVFWVGASASTLAVALMTADLVRFNRTEMSGFREVLDAIPPQLRISALHYTPKEINEYPGEPHGYVASYYLLLKGGYPSENPFGDGSHAPFRRKVSPRTSPWGYAAGFRFGVHGEFFDGFIVRVLPTRPEAPFEGLVGTKVRLVKAAGNWQYYEKLR